MPFVVVSMLVLCYRALVGMDTAPVLERGRKWDTVAELQHMTRAHRQRVHFGFFLRWKRERSNNSSYRKRRFVSVIATVMHATLSYRLVVPILCAQPTAWRTRTYLCHSSTFIWIFALLFHSVTFLFLMNVHCASCYGLFWATLLLSGKTAKTLSSS